MEKIFKEFVTGPVRHTADIKELTEIAAYANTANGESMYMSVYDFTEDYVEYVKEKKSVSGYSGSVSISKLFFDIDMGKGTENMCLTKARNLVDELVNGWDLDPQYIQPWFSGKGFHIITPDFFGFGVGSDVPDKVKNTLTHYFKDIDPVVYDTVRLLRMGNSKHEKTGLYKIPLTMNELMNFSYSDIQDIAKQKRDNPRFLVNWSGFVAENEDKIIEKQTFETPKHTASFERTATDSTCYMTCCQKMYNQGPVKGERHTTLLRLGSWLKRTGMTESVAVKILLEWGSGEISDPNTSFNETEITKIIRNVYDKGYTYWCSDVLMSKYCEEKCVYFQNRENHVAFKNNEQVSNEFIDWFTGFNYDNSVDIGTFCGSHVPWWANPKELIVVSGDSGAGKSAFMQILMLKSGLRTAYYQMEMGEELDRLRFNKMYFQMDDEQLKDHFKGMNRQELMDSQKVFDEIYFKSAAPSIDFIKKEVAMFEPKIIVIDTMDMINSRARSRLDQQRDIVIKLKRLAIETDSIVFAIAHKTKSSSDVHSEFYNNSNNAIAGDGAIFQKSDKILFVTTPRGQGSRERSIVSSKNRNEGLLNEKMLFIGEQMLYKPAQ